MFDYYHDRFETKRFDCNPAISDLESERDTMFLRLCSVQWSCGLKADRTLDAQQSKQCQIYQRYKGRIPIETLLQMCSAVWAEAF